MRHVLVIGLVVLLASCERGKEEAIYGPGEYVQKLDARGKRHVVTNVDGKPVAKLRVRGDMLRVYGEGMTLLGELEWKSGTLIVSRRGEAPRTFVSTSPGVTELVGHIRIEEVERGWAVFDLNARRLGYFDWLDDGRLALRDDYSAAPRLFAGVDGPDARTPSGEVRVAAVPPYSAAELLPFDLEAELDALDRLALGMWLVSEKPPTAEP